MVIVVYILFRKRREDNLQLLPKALHLTVLQIARVLYFRHCSRKQVVPHFSMLIVR